MYVEDAHVFEPAVNALGSVPITLAAVTGPAEHSLKTLLGTSPGAAVEQTFAAVHGASVAKILFTSGSTGTPKGVINTHEMLCANQQTMRQAWPFLQRERPVLVDWLPWSHTFGGNHNVNMMMANGGSL